MFIPENMVQFGFDTSPDIAEAIILHVVEVNRNHQPMERGAMTSRQEGRISALTLRAGQKFLVPEEIPRKNCLSTQILEVLKHFSPNAPILTILGRPIFDPSETLHQKEKHIRTVVRKNASAKPMPANAR